MEPALAIGQLSITGVEATTAPALCAAIETALAALPSPATAQHIASLRLEMPHGATAEQIAAAIAAAVARHQS